MHVAADYRLWVRDPKAMYAANVEGTRDLLRIAREQGVGRFIYTSSVATMGFRKDGTIVDEATPVSLAEMIGHYKRSKFVAEQEAIQAARAGQAVVILNPTTPVGANDLKPTPTGGIIVDFLNRKFPAYVDTGLNLVDVAEVARTHADALTVGVSGERYILGGENLTLKQILDKLSAIAGLPSPTMKVPHAVAMVFAFFDENITGRLRRQGAAGDSGGGADGQEDDVRLLGKGGAGARLSADASLSGASGGGGVVSRARLCAARRESIDVPNSNRCRDGRRDCPLVRRWKLEPSPQGVTVSHVGAGDCGICRNGTRARGNRRAGRTELRAGAPADLGRLGRRHTSWNDGRRGRFASVVIDAITGERFATEQKDAGRWKRRVR